VSEATYGLHGLRILSAIPLPAVSVDGSPDLTIELRPPRPIPVHPPNGSPVSGLDLGAGRGHATVRDESGYLVRYLGICDVRLDVGLERAIVVPDPSADLSFVTMLITGNVLAFVLAMKGACVLHASAVRSNGVALAIVGPSGMGKSTMAAWLCSVGAGFVSDDVLHVRLSSDDVVCHQGPRDLRLRRGAIELIERLDPISASASPDGRTSIEMPAVQEPLPLAAVVVPRLSRVADELLVERLPLREALCRLAANPRVAGWQTPGPVHRQFRLLAELARRVPVFDAEVPWGPPFETEIAVQLLSDTGLLCTSRLASGK
jgi:hypothetical protein